MVLKTLMLNLYLMASAQLMPGNHTFLMDAYLTTLMQKYHVSVVGYAVVSAAHVTHVNTLALTSQLPAGNASLFQAASLSKPLAAFAALNLVSKNQIQLDVPVNQQLRHWKIPKDAAGYSERVTPRECLSMTSGLTYGKPGTVFGGYSYGQPVPTLDQLLNGLAPATNPAIRASFNPGQVYAYTGAGYMVLQKLMQEKTGRVFQTMMEQDFFPKLSMSHSSYACPLSASLRHLAIPGFDAQGQALKGGWDNIPAPASGGLWSTPTDLAHFMLVLSRSYLGQKNLLVSKNNSQEMLTCQPNSLFGLGVVVKDSGTAINFRKVGYNAGYANALLMFPHTAQGIVVMTNSANGLALIQEFIRYVALMQHWPHYTDDFDETQMPSKALTAAPSQGR